MNLSDTIVACASPPGRSARALIRLSGSAAWEIIAAVSHPQAAPPARQRGMQTHRLCNDCPCLLLCFPGPHSYTGEDVVELALPGNPTLIARIVALCIDAGARHAEPGEFTARAWLNGRLTLTQAEGVAALISAASDAQLRAAGALSANRLGRVAADLCQHLAAALALVEAGIDFTDEEDIVAIAPADLAARLDNIAQVIGDTLDRAVGSESLSALPRVVLVGPPNAGKSTLFNALLGRRRAVVSDVRGTTRDVIAEPMHLDARDPLSPEVLLIDVAGLDDSPLGLNPQMQRAAREAIATADLLIELHEKKVPGTFSAEKVPGTFSLVASGAALRLVVQSKSDLPDPASTHSPQRSSPLPISALTGEGLPELRRRIAEALADRVSSLAADSLALLPRHEQCLRQARDHLAGARAQLDPAAAALHHPELIAASMRSGLDQLGQLAGDISPDDILGRIFAGFCIGK